jgi:hypothetical protein
MCFKIDRDFTAHTATTVILYFQLRPIWAGSILVHIKVVRANAVVSIRGYDFTHNIIVDDDKV